jgi:hypothetical protein
MTGHDFVRKGPKPRHYSGTDGEVPIDNNTSGQGERGFVPPEIRRWNWGAFLLNWIWGIGNDTYIALLLFIPLVTL